MRSPANPTDGLSLYACHRNYPIRDSKVSRLGQRANEYGSALPILPLPPTPTNVEIGATPTVDNCKAVLKEMPLEACSVTAAWRSRGCLADAIIIQPGGHRRGGGAGAGMGEAPPPPAAESPLKNASLGNDRQLGAPEVNDRLNKSPSNCRTSGVCLRPREGYFSQQFHSLIPDMGLM